MKRTILSLVLLGVSVFSFAQTAEEEAAKKQAEADRLAHLQKQQAIRDAEMLGVRVEVAAIAGFRGARSNTISGYGLVVGLAGTGDSKQVAVTTQALANALTRWGTLVSDANFKSKNIAIVSVTAEMPPFGAPGRKIDVTVQSIGDCKSLEGGTLIPTTLGTVWEPDLAYAVAGGPVSIGGFNAGGGGSSVRKNHPTVGRIPNGGDIQRSVETQTVFDGNKIYVDLDDPDFTTAQRLADAIQNRFPSFVVQAEDAVTVQVQIDNPADAVRIMGQIEKLEVMANTIPTVVINERTGTIVVGGNVKLGPALIAHGSLRVRIETEPFVSQPEPLSNGVTVAANVGNTTADEDPPQVTVIAPNASLDDLARIFQTLNLSARDIIAILQALSEQGALKARIKIQ
ncbi:MAG: flagellar basal body P-ring protein FlgI [Armatimonadetes bacterium]|nr:flagellar basal body P-ring protein FlgI [Armatimonadota bacterium]